MSGITSRGLFPVLVTWKLNIMQEFFPNSLSEKSVSNHVILYKVEHIMCRYFFENLGFWRGISLYPGFLCVLVVNVLLGKEGFWAYVLVLNCITHDSRPGMYYTKHNSRIFDYVLQFLLKGLDDILANRSLHELEELLQEGPTRDAYCYRCGNFTSGDRCKECITGHFRATGDLSSSCRPYVSSLCLALRH
jgi:hypothetical protein